MLGAVLVWYAAGAVIAVIVALELRARKGAATTLGSPFSPLLWLALAAAALIFMLWPWVALNLAENVSM